MGATQLALGQFNANGTPAPCQSEAVYTNGLPNDPIYYYQSGQLGSLTATPPSGTPGWSFAWSKYNPGTNSWVTLITQNNLPSSTMNNLQQGAYRVTITDGTGTVVGCFRAWVLQITQAPSVTISPIAGDCNGPITLSGTVQNPVATPYHNLPPDPMIINAQTQISVCFSANHTYVSDLSFHLRGPAQCGSPDITLAASPGICNSGDNVNNLCFTTAPGGNYTVCSMPTPLTGNISSAYGTPINWSPLNGCDATAPGWRVELWDCVGGDQGTMTGGSLTIIGTNACGQSQTVTYQSPAGFSQAIAVVSCNTSSTAAYTVSNPAPTNINCTFGYQWTSDPPTTIPTSTSSLNIPISSLTAPDGTPMNWQDIDYTLSITSPCTGLTNCINSGMSATESFILQTLDNAVIDDPALVCVSGSTITLTATPSLGIWSGTGITDTSTGTFDPAIAGVGNHTITFTPNDACTGPGTKIIEVTDLPNVTINSPDNFCIDGADYQFSGSATGGTWSGTAISSSGLFSPSTAGLGTYTITYEIQGSCPLTVTKDITVNDLPIISAGNDMTICSGSMTQLQASGGVSYSWTPTTGLNNANTATPNATPPSNNSTYTVVGTDALGCSNTDSVTLTFFDGPTVTASDDPDIICPGTPTPLSATGATANGSAGSYMWNPSIGVIGAATATPTVSPLQTTTYTVTFTDNCGLTATDQVIVPTEEYHSVSLPSTAQFCTGESIALQATITGSSPSLLWTSNAPGFDNTAHTTSGITVNEAGSYTLTVTSPMGCIQADQIVVSQIPLPNPHISSPIDLCPGKNVTINAGSNWDAVQWSSGQTTPSIIVTQPGTYSVNVTKNGCSNSTSATVNLIQMPVVNLGPDVSICDGASVTLTAPVIGQWNTGAVTNSIQVTTAGKYSVTVHVGACVTSDSIDVRVKPKPIAKLPIEIKGCLGTLVTINASNAVNTSYMWSTGETTPMIEVGDFGEYTVTTSNDCGSVSNTTNVRFEDCTYAIYIPNTFTPDNDGINEVWKLSTYNIQKLTLQIFNRWGDTVFVTQDLNPIWNGTVNGGGYYATDGVYSYHMLYETVNGELGERSGNVLLLR